MIRTVRLLDYLPQFMQEYREMQYIMSAEQPEVQTLCDSTESIKNNQFITTCSEQGISKYENMLDISLMAEESLQERKAYVLAKWIDSIPYTMTVLKRKLNALLGENQYTLNLDNENYSISVTTPIENSALITALDELLDNIIPANLIWSTLYTGMSDIEFETELFSYLNDSPQCGEYECGEDEDMPFMI